MIAENKSNIDKLILNIVLDSKDGVHGGVWICLKLICPLLKP